MRRLELAEAAAADLRAIGRYSERTWGAERKRAYIADLAGAMHRLRDHPLHGRARPDIDPDIRSLLVGQHLILYEFDDERVRVLRVAHQRMDLTHAIVDR